MVDERQASRLLAAQASMANHSPRVRGLHNLAHPIAASPHAAVQRKVYIDPYNTSKIPSLKSLKLGTKKKLAELLGEDTLGTKDDRNEYLYAADDPRLEIVVAHVVNYFCANFTLNVDQSVLKEKVTATLKLKAAGKEETWLNREVDLWIAEFRDKDHLIADKERPAVMGDGARSYSAFIGHAYDAAVQTPQSVVRTRREDVISSFTSSGQQVNTIAFVNHTPVGVFHNKDRDKTVVPPLKAQGYAVPDPKAKDNVHSHSEDEVIYEVLFGNLKNLVSKEVTGEGLTTITFMISDLTCNHNQITSKDQRKVRSCAENIVRFATALRKMNKTVQVQVIYARPYGLNYITDPKGANYVLGEWAKGALQIFWDNGIRARAIKDFFTPEQIDTTVLADPCAYKLEQPGTPEGFDPSNSPFPSFSKRAKKKPTGGIADLQYSRETHNLDRMTRELQALVPGEASYGVLVTIEYAVLMRNSFAEFIKELSEDDEAGPDLVNLIAQAFPQVYEASIMDAGTSGLVGALAQHALGAVQVREFQTWPDVELALLTVGQRLRVMAHHPDISDRIFEVTRDYDPGVDHGQNISRYIAWNRTL
jgi:hypothetical protein